MKLDFDTVIPGHGPVTNTQGLIRQGKSQDEVAMVMTAEFGWLPGCPNMQWSMPGMMRELK
jgi:hypothetical protein